MLRCAQHDITCDVPPFFDILQKREYRKTHFLIEMPLHMGKPP